MSVLLTIELDKEIYECGSEVTGGICLKTREPLCVSRMSLIFSKEMKLKLQKIEEAKGEGDHHDVIERREKNYRYEFDVYANKDHQEKISSGFHVFPFRFKLRSTDEGSAEIKGLYFDFLCNIVRVYNLSAEMYMVDAQEPAYTACKEIQMIDPISEPSFFRTTIEISPLICFFSKKYDISFELDKPFYYSGDCLTLRTSALSKVPIIRQIECFIYEILSVPTDGKWIIRTKYISGADAKEEDGMFETCMRIPSRTPSSVVGEGFSMKVVLFINIVLRKGSPIRIKKLVNVIKKKFAHPEIDDISVLKGDVYPEKAFMLL